MKIGEGFKTVAHFKKGYKKVVLGLAGFSLFQGLREWNLGMNSPGRPRRDRQPR